MKLFFLISLFLLSGIHVFAQEDDSVKIPKSSLEISMFYHDDTLTHNDYLLSIERVIRALNRASLMAQPVPEINAMNERMNEDDSAIKIIKSRLYSNERTLNIRSLQMFDLLLAQIFSNTKDFSVQLNKYDSTLDGIKKRISDLKKDTVLRRVFRYKELRNYFEPQLEEISIKWKKADSLLKRVNMLIDNTLARTSDNIIATEELQLRSKDLTETVGSRAFSKERRYLWEPDTFHINNRIRGQFKKNIAAEKNITKYYFLHTNNQFVLLLVIGLIFFFWVFSNYRSLKKHNKTDSLKPFQFIYINRFPVFASLVFLLNLAPLFDLHAPIVYVETIEFLLMVILTVSFWERISGKLFYVWIGLIVLFLLQFFSRYAGIPFAWNRWLLFILNCLSSLLGVYALWIFRKEYSKHKTLSLMGVLYTVFNLLAALCNLYGRVTLMQIFSSTGTYAFIQTVALVVFVQSVTEAFLLQIQGSRIRKNYADYFDYAEIAKGISRLVVFFAVIIWLIVFTTNLDLFNLLFFKITRSLSMPRVIGNFTFTLGGIMLFLAILWIANFLQKYIAYFFGDVGDDSSFNNKSQRSRLMIMRLVLLVAGFLLAVVASGLPIDRITVILGALSVGIGLGLQSIVNNFVSGIVLIFDRSLRIGDTVEIGDKKGRVKEISMRSTTLLTPEGAEVIIPNGDILSHNFVNWSLSNNYMRVYLSFNIEQSGIAEDTSNAITEIVKSSPNVLTQKEPEILVNTITLQSTQLKIYFWCSDVNKSEETRSNVYASVYKHLQEKGIKIL